MWKATPRTFFRYRILHQRIFLSAVILVLFMFSSVIRPGRSAFAEPEILSTVDGKQIYQQLCAHCHGKDGRPGEEIQKLLSPPPTDLTNQEYKYGDTLEEVATSIRQGIGSNMLRFKERLSEDQIQAVASFVITLKTPGVKENVKETQKHELENE